MMFVIIILIKWKRLKITMWPLWNSLML